MSGNRGSGGRSPKSGSGRGKKRSGSKKKLGSSKKGAAKQGGKNQTSASRKPHRKGPQKPKAPTASRGGGPALRPAGKVSIERPVSRIGIVTRSGRLDSVTPLFERGQARPIDATSRKQKGAREGDIVLLAGEQRTGRQQVERVIGSATNAQSVIEALMLDRGLSRSFPEAVEREAAGAATRASHEGRVDLRDLATFTIDPVSAKDFDDAISAEHQPDGRIRVWVHIADVTAFMPVGSSLDLEARSRATSVYAPGLVEPMLPHVLSSGACSLMPGEDRLAVTIEMLFDGADVVESSVSRTIIRSDERLDYDEADRILRGEVVAREPWAKPFDAARKVSLLLAEKRTRGHAITIDRPEKEFTFDADGNVNGWETVEQTESHRLIEMLMVSANSVVAQTLVERGAPALHRVHERPDAEAAEMLLDQLATLEIPTPPAPKLMSPSQAVEIVAKASVLVDHWTRAEQRGRLGITSLVLRALKQARYDAEPLGHSGLGLEHYCHFTSPIRRYPDVICHRAILASLGLGEKPPSAGGMEELAIATSAREREAMGIERDADDIASCFLLEREIESGTHDGNFDGEVVGLIEAGLFVDFGGAFEGMMPVRRLPGGWWNINPERTMLSDDRGSQNVRLGDQVEVKVGRVDAPRGRCDLYPVSRDS